MSETAKAGLFDAMLAVQTEVKTLPKDRTVEVPTKKGGTYTYSYTPLDTIVETVGPLLTKNSLVWSCKPSWLPGIGPTLKYKLSHAPSREFEDGEMPLMLDDDAGVQDMGSAITYTRRYALVAVLNLVADMDDDGAAAHAGRRSGGSARPASEKQISYVKSLFKQKKSTTLDIRAMLTGAGVTVADDADPVALVDGLTGAQASEVIEFASGKKLVPSGVSDVPGAAPGEFEHPVEAGAGQFDVVS